MGEFGSEFVNKISDKYSEEGWAETTPFGYSSEDVDCVVCGDARVENSKLILSNLARRWCHMLPRISFLSKVEERPSR